MRSFRIYLITGIIIGLMSCQAEKNSEQKTNWVLKSGMTKAEYRDKVLGFLVGSAIGDAFGAPTEMWTRADIKRSYGFVDGLDSMIREKSPEGVWINNLPAGGTTDDTRWKVLTLNYLAVEGYDLHPRKFAKTINRQYLEYLKEPTKTSETSALELENKLMKANWLIEWNKVSEPYIEENLDGYIDSLGKFYGGEMVCAGLLYSPAIGLLYPGEIEKAYRSAYQHSIYDLGYAKDLSAISAAMVSVALDSIATKDNLLIPIRIDPSGYFESRLIGRTAYRIWMQAKSISDKAKSYDSLDHSVLGASQASLAKAYELLDQAQQDMPFHAGEISLQAFTAMIYTDFDFMQSLIFLTNYGRDNDTTASLVGGILGAFYGFDNLPQKEKMQVIEISRTHLGVDLLQVAEDFTDRIYSN